MLEYKKGILILLFTLIPYIVTQTYADSIFVEFNKLEYHKDDSITISGQVLEFKMPVIAMSIYDPDGKILSANNVEVDSSGFFSKTFLLDSTFYNKIGEYKIKLNYGKLVQNEFFNITENDLKTESNLSESLTPEIILLWTDKTIYTNNDTIMINGFVSSLESPTVLIGVYDPFGNPAGFYFEPVNSDLEFSTKFLVKAGVNFKMDGTYSVKAHYGESEELIFFDFYKEITSIISDDASIEDDVSNNSIGDNPISIDDTKNTSNSSIINNPTISNNNNSLLPKNNSKENTKIILTTPSNVQIKKSKNLSVEDIELGKILNQINLQCDSSKFVDTISYYDGMGPALYRLCKFDQALIFFDESLIMDPNNVEILTNKGSTLGKLGQFSESIIFYNNALEINPNFIPAINNKANALANMENLKESILLYQSAIEINPDFQTARKNLSIVLSEMPVENSIIYVEQGSISQETESENIVKINNNSKFQIENSSKLQMENSSNIFENIGIVFSSLGSLFSFLK